MPKLDHFLNLIEDGAWHSLNKLSKHSKISKQKLEALSKLLSETNILEYETNKNQVRIKKEWQQMLRNTDDEQQPSKTAVGTIMLPAKKSIDIQGIRVSNLTERELELAMRINKKLEELGISLITKAKST